jgi:hypothetical protein
MLDSLLAFAGVHPIVAVCLGIPLIGWTGNIIVSFIRLFRR